MLYIAHGLYLKIGPFQIWDLSMPSERAPSNLKIIEFRPSEL